MTEEHLYAILSRPFAVAYQGNENYPSGYTMRPGSLVGYSHGKNETEAVLNFAREGFKKRGYSAKTIQKLKEVYSGQRGEAISTKKKRSEEDISVQLSINSWRYEMENHEAELISIPGFKITIEPLKQKVSSQ